MNVGSCPLVKPCPLTRIFPKQDKRRPMQKRPLTLPTHINFTQKDLGVLSSSHPTLIPMDGSANPAIAPTEG